MSDINQWIWIYLLHNLYSSTLCINMVAEQMIMDENFRQVMFIWYVLLVKEIDENCVVKYILLGGSVADIARISCPEKQVLVHHLLTWAFYAVGRRSVSKVVYARLRRLLGIWQNTNVVGYKSCLAMKSAFMGTHPKLLGALDLKIDIGVIAGPCGIENGMEASKIIDIKPEYQENACESADGIRNLSFYKSQKPSFPDSITSSSDDSSGNENSSSSSSSSSSSIISSISTTSSSSGNSSESEFDHENADDRALKSENTAWTGMEIANGNSLTVPPSSIGNRNKETELKVDDIPPLRTEDLKQNSKRTSKKRTFGGNCCCCSCHCCDCSHCCSRDSKSRSKSSSRTNSCSATSNGSDNGNTENRNEKTRYPLNCSSRHKKCSCRHSSRMERHKQRKILKSSTTKTVTKTTEAKCPKPLVEQLDMVTSPLVSLDQTLATRSPAPATATAVSNPPTTQMPDDQKSLELLTVDVPSTPPSISRPQPTKTDAEKSRGKDMKTVIEAYLKSPVNLQYSDDGDDEKATKAHR